MTTHNILVARKKPVQYEAGGVSVNSLFAKTPVVKIKCLIREAYAEAEAEDEAMAKAADEAGSQGSTLDGARPSEEEMEVEEVSADEVKKVDEVEKTKKEEEAVKKKKKDVKEQQEEKEGRVEQKKNKKERKVSAKRSSLGKESKPLKQEPLVTSAEKKKEVVMADVNNGDAASADVEVKESSNDSPVILSSDSDVSMKLDKVRHYLYDAHRFILKYLLHLFQKLK